MQENGPVYLEDDFLRGTPFYGDFEVVALAGQGSFGKVYKVNHKLEKKLYALKVLFKESDGKSKISHLFRREAEVLQKFKCNQIVKLYSFHESSRAMYLLLEYCEGGDLSSYIRARKSQQTTGLTEKEISVIVGTIIKGLHFLHYKCNCLHRDIKPTNILIRSSPQSALKEDDICIGDLGLCVVLSSLTATKAKIKCGTDSYQSPEQITNQHYDAVGFLYQAADMFSLAIMSYVIRVGEHPFLSEGKLDLDKQKEANWAFIEKKDFSDEFKHFLIETGNKNKHRRLTSFAALQHPFITGRYLSLEDAEILHSYYEERKTEFLVSYNGFRSMLRLVW